MEFCCITQNLNISFYKQSFFNIFWLLQFSSQLSELNFKPQSLEFS